MALRRRFLSVPVAALSVVEDAPPPTADEFALIRVSRRAMATTFEVALPVGSHPEAIAAAVDALDLIDELEDQMTIYREHSEISRINAAAATTSVAVEAELFDLFERCLTWTRETEGAFDIAMGSVIKAWGFHKRQGRVPTARERSLSMARSGSRHIVLNREARTIKLRRDGLELNLGAVGKGYALDRAAERLRKDWGVRSALLHGGGSSVYAIGHPPGEERGWPIRLRHPIEPEQSLGIVWLADRGLGTSAATFQSFEHSGKKLGHLLDPRTGWPASAVMNASVLATTAAEADALSTAAFVLGDPGTGTLMKLKPSAGAVLLVEQPVKTPVTERPPPAKILAYNLKTDKFSPASLESITVKQTD